MRRTDLLDAASSLCKNAEMPAQHLSNLRNLGPKSGEMLATIGITTPAELTRRGAVDTYATLVKAGMPVSLNLLWALVGALTERDWREVARDDRLALLMALEARGVTS